MEIDLNGINGSFIDVSPFNIKEELIKYFNNKILIKAKHHNIFGIYYSKINTQQYNKNKFIVVTVPYDNSNIGTTVKLDKLNWNTFQTRTLEQKDIPIHFDIIPLHNYNLTYYEPFRKINLKLIKQQDLSCTYVSSMYNIKSILYAPDIYYNPPNETNLWSLIESFQCMIYIE